LLPATPSFGEGLARKHLFAANRRFFPDKESRRIRKAGAAPDRNPVVRASGWGLMTVKISNGCARPQIVAQVVPFIIVALAGMAVRTPLASAHPFLALILFLWIVADTLMLALVVRSSGKPEWRAVLGVLAGASFTVWLGSPSVIRGYCWMRRSLR
jgi:hypothetical protein